MRLSRKRAFAWIGLSVVGVQLLAWPALLLMRGQYEGERFTIRKVVQSSPHHAALPTPFFIEQLQLATDTPQNLYQFSVAEGKKSLEETLLFSSLRLKRWRPDTLLVEYTLRQPIAYIGDLTNTVCNHEGRLFPFAPYFTPKKLPQLVLGKPLAWGDLLPPVALAHFAAVTTHLPDVATIDLTMAGSPTLGKKEIVLTLANGTLLRLDPSHVSDGIAHYHSLATQLLEKEATPYIIDLRQQGVAYLRRKR